MPWLRFSVDDSGKEYEAYILDGDLPTAVVMPDGSLVRIDLQINRVERVPLTGAHQVYADEIVDEDKSQS